MHFDTGGQRLAGEVNYADWRVVQAGCVRARWQCDPDLMRYMVVSPWNCSADSRQITQRAPAGRLRRESSLGLNWLRRAGRRRGRNAEAILARRVAEGA